MASPTIYEITGAVAAVVSAIGGTFAVVAAFRSAASAEEATQQANESERRALIREVSSTASTIMAAVLTTASRGQELILEYRTAEVLSGSAEHSALRKLQENAASLVARARAFEEDSKLFVGGAKCLAQAPLDEIDRIRTRLQESLNLIQVIREDLDRKHFEMSARNMQQRQIILQGRQ